MGFGLRFNLTIVRLLDLGRIKKMVLMFQSEVADRICAVVGTKQYGRFGVISQLLCKTGLTQLTEVRKWIIRKINQILNNYFYNNPWVGGVLGWFYYLYHKNINKALILKKFL
jgi:hypothetical protein